MLTWEQFLAKIKPADEATKRIKTATSAGEIRTLKREEVPTCVDDALDQASSSSGYLQAAFAKRAGRSSE